MTLRGLPPSDIGEPEYKNMLIAGKRAQFFAKVTLLLCLVLVIFNCYAVLLTQQDPLYPVFLFQFLEDCWHQEHFKRPSAQSLYKAVVRLSGSFTTLSNKECICDHELQGVLLDSYTLHQGHRISACQILTTQHPYTACVALSAPDDYSTTIALVKYSGDDPRTELQAEVQLMLLLHVYPRYIHHTFFCE